jgi:hypothetical protein
MEMKKFELINNHAFLTLWVRNMRMRYAAAAAAKLHELFVTVAPRTAKTLHINSRSSLAETRKEKKIREQPHQPI